MRKRELKSKARIMSSNVPEEHAPSCRMDKKHLSYYRYYMPALLTAVLGISLSLVLFQKTRDTEVHELGDTFEHAADNRASLVVNSIKMKLLMLEATRSFFNGSANVEPDEFSDFVRPFLGHNDGSHGLLWISMVPENSRDQFESPVTSDGVNGLQITECTEQGQLVRAASRQTHFPVTYCEPKASNSLVLGYDLGSNPALLKAMTQARDTGTAVAGPRTRLLNLIDEEYGVYIFLPVYQDGAFPQTVEQRKEQLQGFVAKVFHIDELVEATTSTMNSQSVEIHMIDNSAPFGNSVLYCPESHQSHDQESMHAFFGGHHYRQLQHRAYAMVGGRRWEIICSPGVGFVSPDRVSQPLFVLGCGLLVTILISGYFLAGIGRTLKVDRLVKARTEQLSSLNKTLQREIAERKRAQREIHAREQQYKAVFASSVDGLVVTDSDGVIVDVNPAVCDIYGYTSHDMIGMHIRKLATPEYQEFADDYRGDISTGNVCTCESVDVRKDGTTFQSETRKTPFEYAGTPHVLTVVRDITLSKSIREEKEKLLAMLSNSNSELTRSNERLERSNRELEDFAYIASHDLQEPLRKVIAFGDRLRSKHADSLDETGLDYLSRMQDAAGRMSTLINDLLTYSRVSTKARPFEDVDMDTIVREVLSDLEVRVEQLGATVEVDSLCGLKADPVQMRQLMQNLISNALKFHKPDESPAVRIYTQTVAAAQTQENNAQDGSQLQVTQIVVTDNGIGFDEQYTERIFGMFQRLHGRNEYEGTGVGLAVCRKIADRHNMNISVESALGAGTSFILTLDSDKVLSESVTES